MAIKSLALAGLALLGRAHGAVEAQSKYVRELLDVESKYGQRLERQLNLKVKVRWLGLD